MYAKNRSKTSKENYAKIIILSLIFVAIISSMKVNIVHAQISQINESQWEIQTNSTGLWTGMVLGDIDNDGENEIIFGDEDGKISCIHGKNTNIAWEFYCEGPANSKPVIFDVDGDNETEIIIGDDWGHVYCLNGQNGSMEWNFTTSCPKNSPACADVDGDGYIEVLFGCNDYNLYCIDGRDGSYEWSFPTAYCITAKPGIADFDGDGNVEVLACSWDWEMYCLNGIDGSLNWSYKTDGQIYSTPAISDLNNDSILDIVITDWEGKAHAIHGSNGSSIWTFQTGSGIESSAIIGNLAGDVHLEVIFSSSDENLYCISGNNGSLLWDSCIYGNALSTGVLADLDNDNVIEVIVGTLNGGLVTCSGETGGIEQYLAFYDRIMVDLVLHDLDGSGTLDLLVKTENGTLFRLPTQARTYQFRGTWPMFSGSISGTSYYVDGDEDGIHTALELSLGMNFTNNDTDSDGLLDGQEMLEFSTNQFNNDTDGDALLDYDEIMIHSTDPTTEDTDADGLTDYQEVDSFDTDPLSNDTDSDLMLDGWEVHYGLDPKLNDSSLDLDGDLVNNGKECELGANPANNDTDNDGLLDGWELQYGFNLTFSGDALYDSDADSLNNIWEYWFGFSPLDNDTDDDGILDGFEDYDADGILNNDEILYYADYGVNSLINWLYPVHPKLNDSNGNGILDGNEDFDGDTLNNTQELYIIGTNPLLSDSDGDLLPDNIDPFPKEVGYNIFFLYIILIAVGFLTIATTFGYFYKLKKIKHERTTNMMHPKIYKDEEGEETDFIPFKKDSIFLLLFGISIIVFFTIGNSPLLIASLILGYIAFYFLFLTKKTPVIKQTTEDSKWNYYYYIVNTIFFVLIASSLWWAIDSLLSGQKTTILLADIVSMLFADKALFIIPSIVILASLFFTIFLILYDIVFGALAKKQVKRTRKKNKIALAKEDRLLVSLALTVFLFFCFMYGAGFILPIFNLDLPVYVQVLFSTDTTNIIALTVASITIPAVASQTFFKGVGYFTLFFSRQNEDEFFEKETTALSWWKKKPKIEEYDKFTALLEEESLKDKLKRLFKPFIKVGYVIYVLYALYAIASPVVNMVIYLIRPEAYSAGEGSAFLLSDRILNLSGEFRLIFLLLTIPAIMILDLYMVYVGLIRNYFRGGDGKFFVSPRVVAKMALTEKEKLEKNKKERDLQDIPKKYKKNFKHGVLGYLTRGALHDRRSVLSAGLKISVAGLVLLGIGIDFAGSLFTNFASIFYPNQNFLGLTGYPHWLIIVEGTAILVSLVVFLKNYLPMRAKARMKYAEYVKDGVIYENPLEQYEYEERRLKTLFYKSFEKAVELVETNQFKEADVEIDSAEFYLKLGQRVKIDFSVEKGKLEALQKRFITKKNEFKEDLYSKLPLIDDMLNSGQIVSARYMLEVITTACVREDLPGLHNHVLEHYFQMEDFLDE